MDLQELVRIVRRRALVVVLVFVLVVGGAFVFVRGQPKLYKSSATVAFFPDPSQSTAVGLYDAVVKSLLPTYAQLVQSRSFLDDVARQLPFPTTGKDLRNEVYAVPVSGAGALQIVDHGRDPQRAAKVASAVSAQFVDYLTKNVPGVFVVKVIDDARPPDTPYSPRPKLEIGAAIILGLFLSIAAALGLERLFGRIQDAGELATVAGLPVLGVIPSDRALTSGARIVVGDVVLARVEEAVRTLRTNVLFAMNAQNVRSLVVTGLAPKDGKSTLAANLAVTATELGFDILLVDGDVHRPVQHTIFGMDNSRGLTSTVLEGADPASLPRPTPYAGLRLVTAGPPLATRAQEVDLYLTQLHRFADLADLVIIDSPPLQAAADVRLLAASAGAVLMLVRAGGASSRQVNAAVESLAVLDTPVLGVVLSQTANAEVGTAPGYYKYRRSSPDAEPTGSVTD